MPILQQLNPRRRRPISPRILKAFNKINKAIRSTSSSSSSSSSSSPSSTPPSTTPHTRMSSSTSTSSAQQGFPLLAALPLELQCHVLSFLPIPTLCKTLARTNRYWNHLIDAHIRRELLVLVASGSDVERQPARIQLIFEAQRPIDTVVSKHSLFFSHFGVTNSMPGGVFSTIANFVFVPPPAPAHDEEAEYEGGEVEGGLSGDQPMSRASSRGPPSAATGPRSLEEMAMQRGVHPSSLGRLREEHHSSSVTVARSRSHSRASEGGFTFVAAPLEHRDPQVREREMSASGDRSMESAASATGTGGTGSGTASTDLPHVLGAYDWGAPVSSLVGGGMSPSSIRSRSRARAPRIPRGSGKGLGGQQPTYKMQLDPLDSFETWILSLTVRSKKQLGPTARRGSYGGTGSGLSLATSYDSGYSQTLRFQKRVAEGLDRVYRDWFYAPQSSSEASGVSDGSSSSSATPYQQALWQAAVTPEMVSTFGAINLAGTSGSLAVAEDDRGEGSSTAAASNSTSTATPRKPKVWPSLRKLEIDNASCQAIIQPHPSSNPALPTGSSTSSAFHPALQANYSHAYLGSSTAYSHLNSTHRMEMKFHVEAVEVHAGRLLTALLELEEEVGEAVREARGRRMAASARWGGAGAGDGRGIVVASASGSGSSMSMAAQDPATMAAAAQFMGLTDGAWAGVGALPYGRQQRARQTEVILSGGEGSGGGGGGGVDAMDYDD